MISENQFHKSCLPIFYGTSIHYYNEIRLTGVSQSEIPKVEITGDCQFIVISWLFRFCEIIQFSTGKTNAKKLVKITEFTSCALIIHSSRELYTQWNLDGQTAFLEPIMNYKLSPISFVMNAIILKCVD